MAPAHATSESGSATYEIHLQDAPPDTLVARYAPSGVRRTPAHTVLMGRVASQDELAGLIDRVLTMGLVLSEVHELRMASGAAGDARPVSGRRAVYRSYEVRVDGQLDGTLLRYLRWPHRHVPEQAALSLEGTPERVHEFLTACCSLGLGIERVRMISTRRARGPGVRRPLAG